MKHRLLGFTLLALSAAGAAQAQVRSGAAHTASRQQPAMRPTSAGHSAYEPMYEDGGQCYGCAECSDCSACDSCCTTACAPRVYAQGDVLLWWTKGNELPPLVTTADAGTPIADAGVLGLRTTTILFGNDEVNDDMRVGGRLNVGYWLDDCQDAALELNVFALEEGNDSFFASSDEFDILARPFFAVDLGVQAIQIVSFPGFATGSVSVEMQSELIGSELNFRHNFERMACQRTDLIVGYRYLRLDETLEINNVSTLLFAPVVGTELDILDRFATDNEFHGGQIGSMFEYRHGCWTWNVLGKIAFGSMHQEVRVDGRTESTPLAGVTTTLPGGLLAQPTNIGDRDRDEFAVIPELGVKFAYDLSPQLKATVGYTFIYVSSVVRPEDQIDLGVNVGQINNPAADPARPGIRFDDSDFWAQGINLGLEYTF